MTTLERIAQAAYESMVKRTFGDDSIMANEANPFLRGEWSAQTQELKDDWLAVVRAAVETMRELSDSVFVSGSRQYIREYKLSPLNRLVMFHKGVIDAILNEKSDD